MLARMNPDVRIGLHRATIGGLTKGELAVAKLVSSYAVDGAGFNELFRKKMWDGRDHQMRKEGLRHSVPLGLLTTVVSAIESDGGREVVVVDERPPAPPRILDFGFTAPLRDYQQAAVDAFVSGGDAPSWAHHLGVLRMSVRSGKTRTAFAIADRLGMPTFFVVTSQLLLQQAAEVARELCPYASVGVLGDGELTIGDITIATIQGLFRARDKNKPLWKQITRTIDGGLVIFDECFVAGTLVTTPKGLVDIASCVVGDVVVNAAGTGRVTKVHRRLVPIERLRVVVVDGECFVCTVEHPWLTQRGWITAGELVVDDKTFAPEDCADIMRHEKQTDVSCVRNPEFGSARPHVLLDAVRRNRTEGENENSSSTRLCGLWRDDFDEKERTAFLFDVLSREMAHAKCVDGSCESDADATSTCRESCSCSRSIPAHDDGKPDARFDNTLKDGVDTESDRTSSQGTRRERSTVVDAASDLAEVVGGDVVRRMRCFDKNSARNGLTESLQNRYCKPEKDDCNRGGRNVTSREASLARREEDPFPRVGRVASVSIPQRADLERLGVSIVDDQGCVEVFNLSVDSHPSYAVGKTSRIVHNCHHLTAKKWKKTTELLHGRARLGLSATVFADDDDTPGKASPTSILLTAATGPVLHTVSMRDLMVRGFLVPCTVEMLRVEGRASLLHREWSQDHWHDAIFGDEKRNAAIVKRAGELAREGRRVIITTTRTEHAGLLGQMLADAGIPGGVLIGPDSGTRRRQRMTSFRTGPTRVLVSTVLGEGVDVPECDAVIVGEGGASRVAALQRMRCLTPSPGKNDCIVVDVVDTTSRYTAAHTKTRIDTYRAESCFRLTSRNA